MKFSCIWKLVVMKLDVVQFAQGSQHPHVLFMLHLPWSSHSLSYTSLQHQHATVERRGESADLVWLASLICDERGRAGAHGATPEPCGQVVLLLLLPYQSPASCRCTCQVSASYQLYVFVLTSTPIVQTKNWPSLKCKERNVKIPAAWILLVFQGKSRLSIDLVFCLLSFVARAQHQNCGVSLLVSWWSDDKPSRHTGSYSAKTPWRS